MRFNPLYGLDGISGTDTSKMSTMKPLSSEIHWKSVDRPVGAGNLPEAANRCPGVDEERSLFAGGTPLMRYISSSVSVGLTGRSLAN